MFSLKGKVAVVTGASSGLGKQIALAFARQGADLAILARRVEKLEEFKPQLEEAGASKVVAYKCDVTDTDNINAVAAEVEKEFSKVDILTRAFAAIMKKNGYGRIINIASMYGLVGNTEIYTIAYHTSKGAVVNFTRAVAAELATSGITCNAICPGYFETELTKEVLDTEQFQNFAKAHVPMQRYGKPGELDAAAVFLASKEASYVNGVILPVDGGYTCI